MDPAERAAYAQAQAAGIAHPVAVRLESGEWVGVDRPTAMRFWRLGGAGSAAAEIVVRQQQHWQNVAA